MFSKYRSFGLLTLLAVSATFAAPSSASADFKLKLGEDGGTIITLTIPGAPPYGSITYTGLVGDFLVGIDFATTNAPGGGTALTSNSAIEVFNLTGTAHTLNISVSAQGFTSPNSPPPLTVMDTVSGSVAFGTLSGNLQGFTDKTNALFGTGFAAPNLLFGPTGAGGSFSFSGSTPGFAPAGATYSMTLFENLLVSGGGHFTGSSGNVQITAPVAVPAPAGALLLLMALPVFGVSSWNRRRKLTQRVAD